MRKSLLTVLLVSVVMATAVATLPNARDAPASSGSMEPPAPGTGVLPMSVSNAGGAGSLRHWPAFAGDGTPLGLRAWRAHTVGGNCCEHYVATTSEGWIVNLGGAVPVFSKDEGVSWQRATPGTVLIGAEGAVVAAPGGDIVAMTWDPYTGDQVYAYRYDGATGAWHWNLVNLRTAFFDRPWLSVAPGPFLVGGVEVPYVTFLRGGLVKFPQYMSVDGLHYDLVEHTYLAALANVVDVPGVTTLDALPDFGVDVGVDNLNPHPSALGSPLPRGGYLAPIPHMGDDQYAHAVLDQDLTWKALQMDLPSGDLFFDDAGGIHNLRKFGNAWLIHGFSADDGATWTEYTHRFEGRSIIHWAFQVDADLGLAAILFHLDGATTDQGLLVKVRDYAASLAPDETLLVGAGDLNTGVGLLSEAPRFDFTSLGLLPDGRAVAAFIDSEFRPGFAVEQPATAAGARAALPLP